LKDFITCASIIIGIGIISLDNTPTLVSIAGGVMLVLGLDLRYRQDDDEEA
jgi:hypothetical protein